MTAQQMDAVSSFQHVVDNIPAWRTTIGELATYAAKKYEEYAQEYVRLLHLTTPKKKKTGSISSIRSTDEDADSPFLSQLESTTSQPLDFGVISPFEPGNRYLYAQAHRKRKPGTSLRSGASDSTIFNGRQSVVIYYDSHIQAELDMLVKALGIARNNLRKGKNAYTAANGFQLPSLLRRYGAKDSNLSKNPPVISLNGKPQTDALNVAQSDPSDMGATFAAADKELEVIQGLCERAAHQAIRNGECRPELESSLKNLELLLTVAETTLTNLQKEDTQRSAENAQNTNETFGSPATLSNTDTSAELSLPASKAMAPVLESLEAARRPSVLATSTLATSTLALPSSQTGDDTIEVDDDDDSEDDDLDFKFDISKIRSTRILRSGRIMA